MLLIAPFEIWSASYTNHASYSIHLDLCRHGALLQKGIASKFSGNFYSVTVSEPWFSYLYYIIDRLELAGSFSSISFLL